MKNHEDFSEKIVHLLFFLRSFMEIYHTVLIIVLYYIHLVEELFLTCNSWEFLRSPPAPMPRFSPGNGEIIDRMPLIVPSEGLISWRGGIGGYPSIPMMNCNVPRYSIFPYLWRKCSILSPIQPRNIMETLRMS